ncbi:MAG: hypothetical protein M0D57_08620 [Sphingobacteriales bacterium JAD_PAG50586_3]|nr:MAG: hypothetical protein M0D57_08620 [Sphingobacteriales bacterium JAD_PAG50586_3]
MPILKQNVLTALIPTLSSTEPTLDQFVAFLPQVKSVQDYYSFGSLIQNRSETPEDYRFGFNGMEKVNDLQGSGNALDFGARIYDSRLGKWFSTDPLQNKYPGLSPYVFTYNNPIIYKDPDGRDGRLTTDSKNHTVTLETVVYIYGNQSSKVDVGFLNEKWGEIGNSGQVRDSDGKVWTVTMKVTYKYVGAKMSDQMTSTFLDKVACGENPEDNSETYLEPDDLGSPLLTSMKFKDGDNIMMIDDRLNMKGGRGWTIAQGGNSAKIANTQGFGIPFHETGHFLGMDDRYCELVPGNAWTIFTPTEFSGDIMDNLGNNNISQQHFDDLFKFAKQKISDNNGCDVTNLPCKTTSGEGGQSFMIDNPDCPPKSTDKK